MVLFCCCQLPHVLHAESAVNAQVVHDEGGRVWLMLHSGSRNIGNVTAQYYDKIAQEQLAQQGIKVPGGLNYLEIESEHGQGYLQVVNSICMQAQPHTSQQACRQVHAQEAVCITHSRRHGPDADVSLISRLPEIQAGQVLFHRQDFCNVWPWVRRHLLA